MKTTGVIRRIDDLGRIVIPKEIRKTLRIKDGESLEILLDNDNITLKKYSRLGDETSFYKDYVDSVQSIVGGNIMIADNDKLIAISGELKKEYTGATISNYILDTIVKREDKISKNKNMLELTSGSSINCTYAISPIIVNGDAMGAVIYVGKADRLDDYYEKIVKISAKFLSKYIE